MVGWHVGMCCVPILAARRREGGRERCGVRREGEILDLYLGRSRLALPEAWWERSIVPRVTLQPTQWCSITTYNTRTLELTGTSPTPLRRQCKTRTRLVLLRYRMYLCGLFHFCGFFCWDRLKQKQLPISVHRNTYVLTPPQNIVSHNPSLNSHSTQHRWNTDNIRHAYERWGWNIIHFTLTFLIVLHRGSFISCQLTLKGLGKTRTLIGWDKDEVIGWGRYLHIVLPWPCSTERGCPLALACCKLYFENVVLREFTFLLKYHSILYTVLQQKQDTS